MPWLSLRNIIFSSDPLLLKSLVPLEKKRYVGTVLVFEQRIKQRQLNAQINDKSLWTYLCEFGLKLIPCLSLFFEDIQIETSDSRLDISINREPKWDIYTSKSKFGCWQPETNKILKIEVVAIVSWLAKHLAFFLPTRYITGIQN